MELTISGNNRYTPHLSSEYLESLPLLKACRLDDERLQVPFLSHVSETDKRLQLSFGVFATKEMNHKSLSKEKFINVPLLFCILVIHVIGFYLLFSLTSTEHIPAQHTPPKINATLYYRPKPVEVLPTPVKHQNKTIKKVLTTQKKTATYVKKKLNSNLIKELKLTKDKLSVNSSNNKTMAFSALETLRNSIAKQSVENSSLDALNAYSKNKNFISKSNNKFLPSIDYVEEIKLQTKKVDCTSKVHKGISVVSGLMGGRIKCYSTPSLKDFLERKSNSIK
jgi:hypothetical protein